ncbi:MAG: hypothetical protein H7A35_04690 [Planctomycetales bacterium]|nr:hypothetical protein [bacterium]UNM09355.1 MAG: hypothetical protein H7A35_04690 [Planctomycetales bacterium]
MNLQNHESLREALPPLDSQAGLEARLLRLMEVTLAQEQRSRCELDNSLRPLSPQQLRRNAVAELMLHAEEGYFDHMNSLVKRSAMYTASIVAFALGMMLLNGGPQDSANGQRLKLGNTVPAKLHMASSANWNID